MFDGHVRGVVTMHFEGQADVSDKEATFDEQALVKYDYAITAEAWLPLPERLVPTVLGTVLAVKDFNGTTFFSQP